MGRTVKVICWLPRILSIGFVLLLSLFSLDVFSEYGGSSAVLPFLIHLIPSFVMFAVVLVAWKRDAVGAAVFLGFAVAYVLMVGFDRPWSWYAGISVPAAVIGLLFGLSWLKKGGST